MHLLRQFLASDHPVTQLYKGVVGTVSGLLAAISPDIERLDQIVRLIGGAAAAFCSVVMAVGIVVGWVKGRRK